MLRNQVSWEKFIFFETILLSFSDEIIFSKKKKRKRKKCMKNLRICYLKDKILRKRSNLSSCLLLKRYCCQYQSGSFWIFQIKFCESSLWKFNANFPLQCTWSHPYLHRTIRTVNRCALEYIQSNWKPNASFYLKDW